MKRFEIKFFLVKNLIQKFFFVKSLIQNDDWKFPNFFKSFHSDHSMVEICQRSTSLVHEKISN